MINEMDPQKLFERSQKLIPGGVHSPVRGFSGLGIVPRFFKEAKGAYITDTQGKDYIDLCMSFGPLILGHRNEIVEQALKESISKGWSYGACEPYSLELTEYILGRNDYIEQIRFVSSGTEAVMTAVRLARGYTKRNKIIKFNGCYHGHLDSMLIKAGSGLAGTAEASSAGVPEGVAQDTLIVDLGDREAIENCFRDHKEQIAAIIIEPLPANNGLLIQERDFLTFLRDITSAHHSLLIFDEVISGFRIQFGGMAQELNIRPDIITYGKIIGGGLPVGAIGAKRQLMETLAPMGPVYQAGTLSANPLAMVGGLTTLSQLTDDFYVKLKRSSKAIADMLREWFQEYDNGRFAQYQIIQYNSLFWIIPSADKIQAVSEIPSDITHRFSALFRTLLEKGVYLAPNAYEVSFASIAHDETVIKDLRRRLWS